MSSQERSVSSSCGTSAHSPLMATSYLLWRYLSTNLMKREALGLVNLYWLAAGMFVSALIQKKMQSVSGRKGLTMLVMDDNEHEMQNLSDGLYNADPWFDGLYQVRGRRRGVTMWLPRTASNRLDQIINTAFAIKSEHSSLFQVADALAYVYRRKIELQTQAEAYPGERAYYDELYDMIEPRREKTLSQMQSGEVLPRSRP